MSDRWFILQAQDAELDYPIAETRFLVSDAVELRRMLGSAADDDPDLEEWYELEESDLDAIAARFNVRFADELRPVWLAPWDKWYFAPYLNHAGFELPLMLEGRKPFAKFSEPEPAEWLTEYLEKFEPFVVQGRIIKRVIGKTFRYPSDAANKVTELVMREVYFALPVQEWRIDAYLLLRDVGNRSGWNNTFERLEGALLGYSEWENDWHIEHRSSERSPWAGEESVGVDKQ